MNRTPPAHVLKALREEVNYGCPVPNCGSPFLTWHHFDPPWREQQHHKPEGMIALCAKHAQMADAGVYTKAQLRRYKTDPSVKNRITVLWPWEPENIVFLMGGNVFLKAGPVLTLRGKKIFAATRMQIPGATVKGIAFDLDLTDPHGNPIVSMDKNLLSIRTDGLDDLRFTAGSKRFAILHTSGLSLAMRFQRYHPCDFQCHLSDVMDSSGLATRATGLAQEHSIDSDGLIPAVTLMGKLFNDDVTMKIVRKAIKLTCHFFSDEEVTVNQRCFLASGSLSFVKNQVKIMKFG